MGLSINNTEKVKEQYATAKGLSTRQSIHDKYSTNKMGLGNWYFTIYKIEEGMRVLELGAGNGTMWINHKDVIERCQEVIFSDFSEGMLEQAKGNIGELPNVKYEVIDIQDIPYEDESFDVVIANYMLYHVPDLDKALSEVHRVLKKGGCFYSGTMSEHGVLDTIDDWIGVKKIYVIPFSLNNGGPKLEKYFSRVSVEKYIDSLEVTNIDDLMDYIFSSVTFRNDCPVSEEQVRKVLEDHMEDGVIRLPKEPGTFISIK